MNSFIMPIRCPLCAGPVKEVNIGRPMDNGTNINAILRCTKRGCRHQFSVHVFIMSVGVYDNAGEEHGNSKGFGEHRKRGEPLCDECRDWNTRIVQDRTARERVNA